MAFEVFANNAVSNLNGSINNSTTSIAVATGSVFPSTGNFRIRIDDEILLVTARSSNTLTATRAQEGTVAASHADGARVALILTAGAIDAFRLEDFDCHTCQGRMGVVTGIPTETAADVSTLYFSPYQGNRIALYDGSRWHMHTFSEINIAVPSTVWQLYDVFVYDNAGTLTLELNAWTQSSGAITAATNASPIVVTSAGHGLSNNDIVGIANVGGNTAANTYAWMVANVTTDTFELRSSTGNGAYTSGGTWTKLSGLTAPTLGSQNGIKTKNGDATKRYLGVFATQGVTGQTSMNASGSKQCKLLVSNEYNQVNYRMSSTRVNSHTYSTNTVRAWDNDGQNQLIVVVRATPIKLFFSVQAVLSNSANSSVVSIGVNTNIAESTSLARNDGASLIQSAGITAINRNNGIHVLWPTERATGATGTFNSVVVEGLAPM